MLDAIVGLFIPVYYRETKVRACLDALAQMEHGHFLEIHVRIGFNGGPPSLLEYLEKGVPAGWYNTYSVINFGSNIGKGAIVNRMVAHVAEHARLDYVISMDSDIVVGHPLWVENLVVAFEQCPRWKDLGGLSAQQNGECCHVLDNKPETLSSTTSDYSYIIVPENEGVAGGAILTPYHVWRTLGGYRAHRIYASDDADFMFACAKHNLLIPVVNDARVTVFHPPGDDSDYRAWKLRAARDKLSPSELNGFYERTAGHGNAG